jgi:hypothetical protein
MNWTFSHSINGRKIIEKYLFTRSITILKLIESENNNKFLLKQNMIEFFCFIFNYEVNISY